MPIIAGMDPTLDADGALLLPRLITSEQARACERSIRAVIADRQDPSGVTVLHPQDLPRELLALAIAGPLAKALHRAIGPCEFLSLKPVIKDAERAFATPWHQDHAYWGGCRKWSIWLALDDVGEAEGCLRVVPGSHRQASPHQPAPTTDRGFIHRMSEPDPASIRDLPLTRGDGVLFHDLLWHASYPLAPGRRRIALIPTYRSLGAVDSSTIWTQSVPIAIADQAEEQARVLA